MEKSLKYLLGRFLGVAIVLSVLSCDFSAIACTAFVLKQDNKVLFCEGFDWFTGEGMVAINKKGFKKRSILAEVLGEKPMTWTSQYGSITFSWIGMSQPTTGMNSEGLAITSLIYKDKANHISNNPVMGISQWKEYVLDTCSNVNQALATLSKVRIYTVSRYASHYLIGDSDGNCAVIQFVDGKPKIYTGKDLPYPVVTDDLHYEKAIEELTKHQGFGGNQTISKSNGNHARFQRTAQFIQQINPKKDKSLKEQAFGIFDSVRMQGYTRWNIIFDLRNRMVSFQTQENKKQRYIDLNKLDLSCSTPLMLLDINENLEGNITDKFKPYPNKINEELINKSDNFIHFAPDTVFLLKQYPDTLVCSE